jgi:hypothetical protein
MRISFSQAFRCTAVLLPWIEKGQQLQPFYLAILSATTSVLSGYYCIGGFSVWGQ